MLDLWGLGLFGGGTVDYQRFGDIGTWAQGVGTVAAVFVAINTFVKSSQAHKADIERQDREHRTQVYCWITYEDGTLSFEGVKMEKGWYLHFNNTTPLPIQVWTAKLIGADSEGGDIPFFGPIPVGYFRKKLTLRSGPAVKYFCDLNFLDRAGSCWKRSSLGNLISIPQIVKDGQVLAIDGQANPPDFLQGGV